jgi:diadenylate cyclase
MPEGALDLLLGPVSTATWVDWLDVGLLAGLVYGVLRALQGTRAFQIMVGMLLLALLWLGSAAAGLAALHWVLDNLFVYAVIAVLVLFQEDIRQVLARAGGTLFSGSRPAQEARLLEEVGRAVFSLASRRIGALVVLERGASLAAWCEDSHEIDGWASDALMQAVFHPSSPIHDGAVVLRGERIAYAGVFLPLSLSKTLPKHYGTRHRAAIGLTERTDAVCVLVSEERGTVAIVHDAAVTPVVDANDLRQRLQEILVLPLVAAVAPEVEPG